MEKKFALIHIGTYEVYGLSYVAEEIKRHGHTIRWFDGDQEGAAQMVADWEPDFMCYSPLTTYMSPAVALSIEIKKLRPSITAVFGGHHVTACPDVHKETDGVDIIVVGPVYGCIEEIVAGKAKPVLKGHPIEVSLMKPARREYFDAVQHIGNEHTKRLMSHYGCIYNCAYCSISRLRKEYGGKDYTKYWLTRRPISHIIEEAKLLLEYNTREVDFCDDDILNGKEIDEWLPIFAKAWKKEINLSIFGSVTPKTVLSVSDKTLQVLGELVGSVSMGVQAARPESLRLFNRQFQTEEQVTQAFNRLQEFGIPAKLEMIVGLPVDDPVDDAIETIKLVQRVGAGSFGAAFPLMLYPGTRLWDWCHENNIRMNENCTYEWYTGIGTIWFEEAVQKKITALSKLSTFFVKYDISESWMRALIELDLTDTASRKISEGNYYESFAFRMEDESAIGFEDILANTKFIY